MIKHFARYNYIIKYKILKVKLKTGEPLLVTLLNKQPICMSEIRKYGKGVLIIYFIRTGGCFPYPYTSVGILNEFNPKALVSTPN